MKYFEVDFNIEPSSEAAADILSALIADCGFEAFEGSLKAWIQQSQFDSSALDAVIDNFPMPGLSISYSVSEAPDENWNTEWEKNGFEPIDLSPELVIHDTNHSDLPSSRYRIIINPCQAFGTGSHQTTRMILRQLLTLSTWLKGKRVVDAGTGTGILAIMSSMLGAESVFAYDIDQWSVNNAKANLVLNSVSNVTVLEGDASVLAAAQKTHLLIANINRNILLADLPRFADALSGAGARLILSGFYTHDVPMLVQKAASLGFELEEEHNDGEWAQLLLQMKVGKSPSEIG